MSVREERIAYSDCFPFEVLYSESPSRLYPHYHSQIEFMYFYRTSGTVYTCRGRDFAVGEGGLVTVNPSEIHECRDFGEAHVCCITASTGLLSETGNGGVRFCSLVYDSRVCALFEKIREIRRGTNSAYALAVCVYGLFDVMTESHVAERVPERRGTVYEKVRKAMHNATECVGSGRGEVLTPSYLAESVGLSAGRLSHAFREICGMPVGEFIEKEKLAYARRLLCDTDKSVLEVALDCGFSDHSYFTKRFRESVGVVPTEYRRMKR